MNQTVKRWLLLVGVASLVVVIDQTAKYLTLTNLELGESWLPIPGIAQIFRVTRSINTGAAFGMFQGASTFFLILALITVVAFVISYPRLPDNALMTRIAVALITGGALSNAIDRIQYGHVVDYFHVILSPRFSNISNFADHAITLGVILLLIDQWRLERLEASEAALAAATNLIQQDESPAEGDLRANPSPITMSEEAELEIYSEPVTVKSDNQPPVDSQ